ncbi:putative protein YpgQ [Vanrija pseudolonga]|uniref:Purtative protein YpgQ n=1 Tax=Vanrija pseudolonga TaxID=143232 RepID=A0AAF0YHI3_9TREE|nr:purtative protein YpgQ [Vanrija pseudolonga]
MTTQAEAPLPNVLSRLEALVKHHMEQYDPSHDWAHVDRVRNVALDIGKTLPGADIAVIEVAALMHDLADAKYSQSGSLPDNVTRVLDEAPASELSRDQIDLILRIVPAVSYSTEKKLRAAGGWGDWHNTCVELHAVQDADRLDAIGAIGVLRCAAFSGAKNRILLEDEPNTPGNSCEGHFYDKLLKIKDLMKTKAGHQEAEKRHATMVAFLGALNLERNLWHQ